MTGTGIEIRGRGSTGGEKKEKGRREREAAGRGVGGATQGNWGTETKASMNCKGKL